MMKSIDILAFLGNQSAILWDFDGVLIDSMPVREEGFRHTLRGFGSDHVEQLIAFHTANGGWSRYVKFRHFQTEILRISADVEQIERWAGIFSQFCKQQLTAPNRLIPETIQFLEPLARKVPMHIVSGSDGNELQELCGKLSIDKYFLTIDGSPTPKTQLVRNILERYEYAPNSTWLVGDSANDFDAAATNGINFMGFGDPSLKNLTPVFWDVE